MAATTKLSSWLSHAKEDLSRTTEWKELVSELFEAVQQQLTENHVSYFSDLTNSEKILFLDRAAKLVGSSLRHKNLVAKVSVVLDQHLNESIMDELMNPLNKKTKTDLVLESACDSCSNLLQKWPDMRSKLFACFNRPLTPKLRKVIWKMFLSNPKLRDEYFKSKGKTNSAQYNAIGQRCQAFLASESNFENLPKQQLDLTVDIMKKCLIYKQLHYNEPLGDTDYLMVIPFLKVVVEDCYHGDSCHSDTIENVAADLSEMFLTFLEVRPAYMKDSGTKEFLAALKQVGEFMASTLESQDPQLAVSLVKSLPQGEDSATLPVCLANLLRSYLRSVFVGYLPIDTVLYVWDQHILSLKLNKLQCIPTFAVVLMILLRNTIMQCNNTRDVEQALIDGCKGLTIRQFQNEIDNRFIPQWKQLINEEVRGFELPLVDPVATLGKAQPWTWWFQDRPASRQRPEDRHAVREAREMERNRIEQQRRREESQRQREEEERKLKEEEDLQNMFNQEKKSHTDKITSLQQELQLEHQKRSTVERQMGDEITRLREELARIKGQQDLPLPLASPSIVSSPAQPTSVGLSPASSVAIPGVSGNTEVDDILRDLLSTATGGVHQLVHGTELQEQGLQQVAKNAFNSTNEQYKEVEITLFGHELTQEDWNEMTSEQRQINRTLLLNKLQQLCQENP